MTAAFLKAAQTHMVSICLSEATGQTRIRSSLWMQKEAGLAPVFLPRSRIPTVILH
ncbi:unnamed protein product [Tetraodon nigroviridis]|uniref:(spotted green pufferfish) hypothetical protein n=1 Tax=Tetraodon nigroviridis TaxID=99883 RepID=Q4T6A3_TETNG|nr:unnamed protein product [Tetraodon nigroviridis]